MRRTAMRRAKLFLQLLPIALLLRTKLSSAQEPLPHVDDCNFCDNCVVDGNPPSTYADDVAGLLWKDGYERLLGPSDTVPKAEKQNCTNCRGCNVQLTPIDQEAIKFGNLNFRHGKGATNSWHFFATRPGMPGRYIVKVYCIPAHKDKGFAKIIPCRAHVYSDRMEIMLANRMLAEECVLHAQRTLYKLMTEKLNSTQVVLGSVMDLLTGQCDRHGENIFIDPMGQLQYIDQDKSLGVISKCGYDSMLLPGSRYHSVVRVGYWKKDAEMHRKARLQPNFCRDKLDMRVVVDYRCHVAGFADGEPRELGTQYPARFPKCMKRVGDLSVKAIQSRFRLTKELRAEVMKTRATDMLTYGFEWTLANGMPLSDHKHKTPPQPPCCMLVHVDNMAAALRAAGIMPAPPQTTAVLLLGAPGSGKSELGEAMVRGNPSTAFISVGMQLRAEGLVDEYLDNPTEAGRLCMNQRAALILAQGLQQAAGKSSTVVLECVKDLEAQGAEGLVDEYLDNPTEAGRLQMDQRAALILAQGLQQAAGKSSTVVLECVKDLEGAYTLMEVLYLSRPAFTVSHLLGKDYKSSVSKRDRERRVEERQAKWSSQAGSLIEFFSALGVLEEVDSTGMPTEECEAKWLEWQLKNALGSPGCSTAVPPAERGAGQSGTLASLGYATGSLHALQPECSGLQAISIKPVVSAALVTSRAERDEVLAAVAAATGLHDLLGHLPVPLQSVNTLDDAHWVGHPGRYAVSQKADGTRCLLIVTTILDGELLWAGPPGHRKGFFLAFDILSAGGSKLWHLPLQQRLVALEGVLQLEEANVSQLLWEACSLEATAACRSTEGESNPDSVVQRATNGRNKAPWDCSPQLVKKQQAPPVGTYTVTVLRKMHLPVSAEGLKRVEEEDCPYPTDGLVFTPMAMPYVLGMSEMLYKWQPAAQVAADLLHSKQWQVGPSYLSLSRMPKTHLSKHRLHDHLTYECLPQLFFLECTYRQQPRYQYPGKSRYRWGYDNIKASPETVDWVPIPLGTVCKKRFFYWAPRSVRWDKSHGNSEAALLELEKGLMPDGVTQYKLIEVVGSVQASISCSGSSSGSGSSVPALTCHPARLLPFEQLHSMVLEMVESGAVERSVDADSQLEILSYSQSLGPPQSEAAAMFRGLVLHKPSQMVVATPFVRFGELLPADDPEEPSDFVDPRALALALAVSLYSGAATASIKVDGSFVIAFMRDGQLRTATRRRMDSEQAIWAKEWLLQHVNVGELHPGWTYLFEAVYEQNTVLVPYCFEGLLLLAAYDPEGHELMDPAERQKLAAQLGLMAVPCLHGSWEELVARLARGTDLMASTRGRWPEQQAPLIGEGWVVCAADGSRHKIVQTAYKQVSVAARHMHPLTVWDAVRCGGKSWAQLTCCLPRHLACEMHAILDALSDQYCVQSRKLNSMLKKQECGHGPSSEADEEGGGWRLMALLSLEPKLDAACVPAVSPCRVCGCSAEFDEHGDRICYCDTCHGSGRQCTPRSWKWPFTLTEAITNGSLDKGVSKVPSMFLSSARPAAAADAYRFPSLRGLLLDEIKPPRDGSLLGYSPSIRFQQTFVKGWVRNGPVDERMGPESLPLILQLPDHAQMMFLELLRGRELMHAMLVCKSWTRLLDGDPKFDSRVLEAELGEESLRRRGLWRMAPAADDDGYRYRHTGYGSM
eukprot:gene29719-5154_t